MRGESSHIDFASTTLIGLQHPRTFHIWSLYYKYTTRNQSRSADKSLARPTSRCILFDGENISFYASLMYTNSTNIPPIMIINGVYKTQNLLSL